MTVFVVALIVVGALLLGAGLTKANAARRRDRPGDGSDGASLGWGEDGTGGGCSDGGGDGGGCD